MPRILYLWQAGFPWEIRAEKVCQALRREGCAVTILARWKPGQPEEEECDGLHVVRVGFGRRALFSLPVSGNPVWSAAIRRGVAQERPDLVIAREILVAEAAAWVCRPRGLPLLIDMAEHYPATMRSFKKYRRNPLTRFLVCAARLPDLVERRAVARADGIFTVCEEQCQRLHEQFGYPREKTAVVQNTPELANFARVAKGAARPPRVFAYHGTMTAQRGLDNLIRGFALAARAEPGIRLLLAGDGESFAELVALAKASGVADRIRFTGRYRFEELEQLYSETDVGVIPQPPDESCNHTVPNKLYDYFACGKPVIVSPARPLQRLVEQTQTGIVLQSCKPEDVARGIVEMCRRDPAPLSENGLRAAAESMNWDHDRDVLWQFVRRYLGASCLRLGAHP